MVTLDMSEPEPVTPPARTPLSHERVLRGAMVVADAGGLSGLTIRSLATQLGVKPMAVYHHVANKEAILDGIVDLVFAEFAVPSPGHDWLEEMRRRSVSVRNVLRTHPWAIPLLQSRTHPGAATVRHLDACIGTLREGGFSVPMTAHAYALIDSYVYGFALSEAALPINGPETVAEVAGPMMARIPADLFPYLAEFSAEHVMRPDYDYALEVDFGLDVVLDGLAAALP